MNTSRSIAEYWLGDLQSAASTQYDSLMSVLLLVWAVGIVFFVVYVLSVLLRRKNREASDRRAGRIVSWAPRFGVLTIAIVILGYSFQSGVQGYLETAIAPITAVDVKITATQWEWDVEYTDGTKPTQFAHYSDDGSESRAPIILIPVNRPIRLLLTSEDSFHSITIPDFRFKMGVFPDRITNGTFTATTLTPAGSLGHVIYCGAYCGEEHAKMLAFIKVVPQEEFDRWLVTGGRPATASNSPIKRGKILYFRRGCTACHSTTGAPSVGPTWKGLYGSERHFSDGTSAIADDAYIRQSIFSAGAKVVDGFVNQMPPYEGLISDEDADAIIAYIKSLKDTP